LVPVEERLLLVGRDLTHGGVGDLEAGVGQQELAAQAGRELALLQDLVADVALLGDVVLGPGDGGDHAQPVAQPGVLGELRGRVADVQQVVDQGVVAVLDLARLELVVRRLAADRGQFLEVAVEAQKEDGDLVRDVVEGGLLLGVGQLRRVHLGVLTLVGEVRGDAVRRFVFRGRDHHAEGTFVLQVIDKTTSGLRQHRQGAGALGVTGLVDVVDQAAGADDDRRQGGHEHDEPELRPDRQIPQPAGRPAETRHDSVRRLGALAHVTVLLIRTRPSDHRAPHTADSPGRAPEIPSRRVSKRKSSLTRTVCVMRCCVRRVEHRRSVVTARISVLL
jgi:hypothetical protein